MTSSSFWTRARGTVMAALIVGAPVAAEAQQGSDFLFGAPSVSVGLRAGWGQARASSEIFTFTEDRLTVGQDDFGGLAFGAWLSARVLPRLDLALDVAWAGSEVRSEFRDWVDQDDLPIEQTTRFTRKPLTVSAKLYLTERGRSISRLAWIPATAAPYVGAGAGLLWYEFEQTGDWVDEETLEIFDATFDSSGRSGTGHLFGGVDVTVSPRILFNLEGRYMWAEADMERDFVGFDPIDLSGFQVLAGFAVRF